MTCSVWLCKTDLQQAFTVGALRVFDTNVRVPSERHFKVNGKTFCSRVQFHAHLGSAGAAAP